MFANMTYFTGSRDVTQLALINGSRTAYYDRLYVSLCYEGHYVFGDFNRDGLQDAAAVLIKNEGGNSDDYFLAFLINDGTKLIHKKSVELEPRAIINSVTERTGEVVVDMFVHQKGDCNAGPTKRVKKVYDYLELGPDTLVPVAQKADGAPSEGDLRYVDRNQELQDIYDIHVPEKIRKTFDREAPVYKSGAYSNIFTRKFIMLELVPTRSDDVQAVVLFEGVQNPFWLSFLETKNEYFLRSVEVLPRLLDEMLLDEVGSLAYERFWL